jgi:hypothetical protein
MSSREAKNLNLSRVFREAQAPALKKGERNSPKEYFSGDTKENGTPAVAGMEACQRR